MHERPGLSHTYVHVIMYVCTYAAQRCFSPCIPLSLLSWKWQPVTAYPQHTHSKALCGALRLVLLGKTAEFFRCLKYQTVECRASWGTHVGLCDTGSLWCSWKEMICAPIKLRARVNMYVRNICYTFAHTYVCTYVAAKNGETSVYKELAQVRMYVTKHYGPNPPENLQW